MGGSHTPTPTPTPSPKPPQPSPAPTPSPSSAPPNAYILNPAAVLKSLQERLNYLWSNNASAEEFARLQGEAEAFARALDADLATESQSYLRQVFGDGAAENFSLFAKQTSAGAASGVTSRENAASAAARDNFLGIDQSNEAATAFYEELLGQVQRGEIDPQVAIDKVMDSGFAEYANQWATTFVSLHGELSPEQKAFLDGVTAGGDMPLPYGPGEGGDSKFKYREDVAQDITSPEEMFQQGFSEFSRSLENVVGGPLRAPQAHALQNRYQDLYTKYLGEIEIARGAGEDEDVFKESYVNIGKSTDPQFDQETDRMQLQTKRPKLLPFDFLMKNVDIEDLVASTEPSERPGRATGGYRGFVRRLNR